MCIIFWNDNWKWKHTWKSWFHFQFVHQKFHIGLHLRLRGGRPETNHIISVHTTSKAVFITIKILSPLWMVAKFLHLPFAIISVLLKIYMKHEAIHRTCVFITTLLDFNLKLRAYCFNIK
jgi:hypothetical protein